MHTEGLSHTAFHRAGSLELTRTDVKHRAPNLPTQIPLPRKALQEWAHMGICVTLLCQNRVKPFALTELVGQPPQTISRFISY